jgi:hypothetical protein
VDLVPAAERAGHAIGAIVSENSRSVWPGLWVLALAAAAACLVLQMGVEAQNFDLPGTQPTTSGFPASSKILHEFVPPAGSGPAGLFPCTNCHAGGDAQPARPLQAWEGSMMSQSARDFLFYAQLDLVAQDATVRPEVAGMSDMCLRCHSPVGWLEGRSTDLTGRGFVQKDLFGVQCHACHRMVDPQLSTTNPAHPDVANILNGLSPAPPGPGLPGTFGNGMYVMDPRHTRRGPYSKAQMIGHDSEVVGEGLDWTAVNTMGTLHPAMNSPFHRSGNLCGTCHDVSNPTDCLPGFNGTNTQKCFPIERTWTEWRHSAFVSRGEAGNCQSCHMSGPLNGVGFGAPCEGAAELGHLNDIHFHDLTGGNAFIPEVIKNVRTRYNSGTAPNLVTAINTLYPPPSAGGASNLLTNVNPTALDLGIARVKRTLKRAAFLEVPAATATDITVRVTNRTGHKLPTGYPEGRRMWLNVRFLDAGGNVVAESGRYEPATGTLFHDQNVDGAAGGKSYDIVRYTDSGGATMSIGRPTKVWEARLDHQSTGTEFHFALNNRIRMDNRIPPEGWNAGAYADNRASPVIPSAYTAAGWQSDYATGVHHDEFAYPLPSGVDRVDMTLYYQTASREYIEALAGDNPGTLTAGGYNRGSLLSEAWSLTGRSTPVVMRRLVRALVDADNDGLSDGWETSTGLSGNALNGANDDPDGDRLSNAQEFQQGSNPLDPNSPVAGTPRRPVDIVLVLDTSGSMNDPSPGSTVPKMQTLKEAATLFLETWKDYASPDDRIGVVYFGTDAVQFGSAPLLKPFFGELSNVLTDIQGRSANGWTAMGAGTFTAIQGLGAFDPANPRNRHVVLFSNGMQNRSPMIVPFAEIPEFLVMQNQTTAENPEVTGPSNVTIPSPGWAGFPDAAGSLVRVHSVGIGVAQNSGGTAWHDLLRGLAIQQQGKHNFITRAAELEGVFLEDLVESLKGNTLAYVLKDERTLTLGGEQVFEFPVNRSASKFTVVVSWSGQGRVRPLLELVRPDGSPENVGPISRGGTSYSLVTRHLGDFDEDPGQYGNWKLRALWPKQSPRLEAAAPAERQFVVRVHALLDDRDLKYKFTVPSGRFRIGQPLRVTAMATQGNQFLKQMDRVTATLEAPGAAVGAALARSRHQPASGGVIDPDIAATPFSRKLFAAFSDAGFRARFDGAESVHELADAGTNGDDTAGDGIFSRTLLTPHIPGHYKLHLRIVGHTLDGQRFIREETHSVFAQIGLIDPGRSGVRLVAADGRSYVTFQPRDAGGNLLGPGYASLTQVRAGTTLLPVEDLLDGRYRAPLPAGFDPVQPVKIGVSGQTFFNNTVSPPSLLERVPLWLWLLLLLLLIILVLYWFWRAGWAP